jgi:hypothetical protein
MVDENLDDAASESTGSLEEATSAFEALLSGKSPDKQNEPEKKEVAKASSEADAEDDNEPEDQETASEDDQSEDDGEEGSDDEQDEEAEDKSDDKPVVTLEIEGKTVEFTKQELKDSILRQADYTRKTQALAEERRQFTAEIEQAKSEREIYAQLLPAITQQLQSAIPQAPDASLIDTDPAQYLKLRDAYERKLGDYQAAQSEMKRMNEMSALEQQQKLQAYVQSNAEKLTEYVPEWKDAKSYERDKPKVRSYLQNRGFSEEEINQAYDARLVAMAYDAMRWRELKSSKPRPDTPLEKAIKTSPPPAKPQNSQTRAYVEAKKRENGEGD